MLGTLQSHAPAVGDAVFATVELALDDLRQGRFVIVVDSRAPDSEGDLLVAGEKCTPEAINFMATEASGIRHVGHHDPHDRIGPEAVGIDALKQRAVGRSRLEQVPQHGDARRSLLLGAGGGGEADHLQDTGGEAHDRAGVCRGARLGVQPHGEVGVRRVIDEHDCGEEPVTVERHNLLPCEDCAPHGVRRGRSLGRKDVADRGKDDRGRTEHEVKPGDQGRDRLGLVEGAQQVVLRRDRATSPDPPRPQRRA